MRLLQSTAPQQKGAEPRCSSSSDPFFASSEDGTIGKVAIPGTTTTAAAGPVVLGAAVAVTDDADEGLEGKHGGKVETEIPSTGGGTASIFTSASSSGPPDLPPTPPSPPPPHNNNNNNNNNDVVSWLGADDGWELTWPIWHMLPRHERKDLALRHGCQTIGEFEEYMSLQRAVGETTELTSTTTTTTTSMSTTSNNTNTAVALLSAGARTSSAGHALPGSSSAVQAMSKRQFDLDDGGDSDYEEEGGATNDVDRLDVADPRIVGAASPDAVLSADDLVRLGGPLLLVPEDTLHRVFEFLPVDEYAVLALVSPYWKPFTRTEPVYRRLCERLYLNQSQRRALHVGRFNNSYRTMLERRPRVRAGGGVYVLKYSRVQPIQRDMWTEVRVPGVKSRNRSPWARAGAFLLQGQTTCRHVVLLTAVGYDTYAKQVPLGAVLEHVYYRYLYFQENGRVLYALTTAAPHEVFRRFLRVCLTGEPDDAAVWGRYQVRKRQVTVVAQQPWQHVKLDLTIQDDAAHGRYGMLSFDSHVTNTSGNFDYDGSAGWCPNRVVYEVPEEPFRFVRDVRL